MMSGKTRDRKRKKVGKIKKSLKLMKNPRKDEQNESEYIKILIIVAEN